MGTLSLDSIDFDDDKLYFMYRYGDVRVQRGIDFHGQADLTYWRRDKGFMQLVQYCALMYAVYFYSLEFFDQVAVPFSLNSQELHFFESTFTRGLAEYKYQNGIAVDRSIRIVYDETDTSSFQPLRAARLSDALVMNGGGKDGAVGMELARKIGLDVTWFSLNKNASRERIVKASGVSKNVVLSRIVDDFVKSHATLSGHKPMSAYVGLVGVLVAYMQRKKYVVVSNELSADAANIVIDGFEVNHQYSKSSTFEKLLQQLLDAKGYEQKYFSIIRPLHELQVLKIFTTFPVYHRQFLSCNVGASQDSWCLDCSKCAFVVAAFYALHEDAATAIWGSAESLLHEKNFQRHIIELINPELKPFECIGTTSESLYVLRLLREKSLLQVTDEENRHVLENYLSRNVENDVFDMNHVSFASDSFPDELKLKGHEVISNALNNSDEI